ncbi:MAG: hypothetical protein WC734_01610 [Patescibacteria group bacterium]|jgi:hypothetical protein
MADANLFAGTGAQLESHDGIIVFTLGGERTIDNAAKERRWFDDGVQDLENKLPSQIWGLAIDFRNVKAEQSDTVGIKTLATRLLQDKQIGAIAIVKANKGYQLIIRSIVFALTSETGKLKFFEATDMALEWLKIKGSAK